MATPIRYDTLYMHGKLRHIPSIEFRANLLSHKVDFADLVFEDPTDCLVSLSTWFLTPECKADPSLPPEKVQFSELPILTYDTVYWESDNKEHKYSVRNYALKPEDLPSDFFDLVIKITE